METVKIIISINKHFNLLIPEKLTKFQRYGTIIRAIPAGIFEVPTPKFRITVGNNSAVYKGMITFDEETENLPAITNDNDTHSLVSIDKIIFKNLYQIKNDKQ